jgi:prealbumin domain-containing protein
MSLMKPAASLLLTIILAVSIVVTIPSFFELSMFMKFKMGNSLSSLSYAEMEIVGEKQKGIADIKSIENKTSINQIQGKVIVTTKVINEGGGNKKPSDFTITIHGNDPSPSSFAGNSSGTPVKLHMGMYSVTENGLSGYNSTSSDDCSGGMMSVEAKSCTITNIYTKHVGNAK